MRELIAKLTPRCRDEKGATTVVMALMFVCLVAAAGIGIDTGGMALQRSRVQHSVDAAAMAIAQDCASFEPACADAGGATTASDFAQANSDGGAVTVSPGLSPAAGTVLVTVNKDVETKFFDLLGDANKSVSAKARATWTNHPIAGTVLPFAVSLCEYSRLATGMATVIHADINDRLKGAGSYAQSDTNLIAPPCTVPPDVTLPGNPSTISAFEGGLWLSENEGSNNVCNGNVNLEVVELTFASAKNETCTKKYEDALTAGKVVFMAIYAPTDNGHGGMRTDGKVVDMTILGFAPFEVSSRCLDKKDCSRTNISGKFITTSKIEPGFDYGTVGGNFGAVKVELKTE